MKMVQFMGGLLVCDPVNERKMKPPFIVSVSRRLLT